MDRIVIERKLDSLRRCLQTLSQCRRHEPSSAVTARGAV